MCIERPAAAFQGSRQFDRFQRLCFQAKQCKPSTFVTFRLCDSFSPRSWIAFMKEIMHTVHTSAFYITHLCVGCVKSKPLQQCGRESPWSLKDFKPEVLLRRALISITLNPPALDYCFRQPGGEENDDTHPLIPVLTSSAPAGTGSFKKKSSDFTLRLNAETSPQRWTLQKSIQRQIYFTFLLHRNESLKIQFHVQVKTPFYGNGG